MDKKEFIKHIQKRVAQTSVGSSAIRNQGAGGLIKICRSYFENSINLKEFRNHLTTKHYIDYLDELTIDLMNKFPKNGQSWGAARKGLNLFFRDVVYNKYMGDFLEIPNDFEANLASLVNLEVPLDRDVATGLLTFYPDLPKWNTIKSLNPDVSKLYQDKALIYSKEKGLARVHLDLVFWRVES